MPRYIVKQAALSPHHDRYIERLALEMISPGGEIQPLILEEHVPSTQARRVHVIWQQWRDIPEEERKEIILAAYERTEGADSALEISMAEGFTAEEARMLGLLPFHVLPAARRRKSPADDGYRLAIQEEAAHTLLGTRADELRYARLEDANDAVKRLKKALPRSSWEVKREKPLEY